MLDKKKFLELLTDTGYDFILHNHKALFSVDDSSKYRGNIKGSHTKNLFLKNKKNNFFLFSCEEQTNIDLREISKSLALGNLSFAKSEYLGNLLGIKPGSVTPFALLNNLENNIDFYLEEKLYNSDYVNFHPLTNTSTITIKTVKFVKFMIENKKKIHIFSSSDKKILKTHG